MIRKFYVNMYQKGQILSQLQSKQDFVKFYQTDNKSVQIIEFDDEVIRKHFDYNYESCFLQILGIDKYNPYKTRNKAREITKYSKEGYIYIDKKEVAKESEKAYMVWDAWIPKSQTIVEGERLYIKDWVFFKNLY